VTTDDNIYLISAATLSDPGCIGTQRKADIIAGMICTVTIVTVLTVCGIQSIQL